MNILILGHGGREHALIKLLSKSRKVTSIYALNGNPGMLTIAKPLVGDESPDNILQLCKQHAIAWVIPGGETYLCEGITDVLLKEGIKVFGPTKKAAQIESSKTYAKMIMEKYHVPTALYRAFDKYQQAFDYCTSFEPPYVIKYDGLAFGKGVTIALSLEEASNVLKQLLEQKIYGHAKVIIEEYLVGEEFSLIAMVNHHMMIPLPPAKDHKTRYEYHQGPNTGGMGAYSPVDFIDNTIYEQSLLIMKKVVDGMVNEHNPFTGFLYGGFILTKEGPKIIEFNCRLGDPEAEVILPRIASDFLEAIISIDCHQEFKLEISSQYHLGVVMVSDGYPGAYQNKVLLDIPSTLEHHILHMGTMKESNQIFTNGGRVLLVSGEGKTLELARQSAYQRVDKLVHTHLKYRTDIGETDKKNKVIIVQP